MISDHKERAEHRMLVDLMRNDVGRIAQPNQVWVEFDVEAYGSTTPRFSNKGRLSEHIDVFDAIQNIFPGGSITGCPRTVVCAAIDELEQNHVRSGPDRWVGLNRPLDHHLGTS